MEDRPGKGLQELRRELLQGVRSTQYGFSYSVGKSTTIERETNLLGLVIVEPRHGG
jgi:hypothetical protein